MRPFAFFLAALISISIAGCWNNADSDPHQLPPPPPSSSADAGSAQLCFRNFPGATPVETSNYCTSMLRFDASAQSFGQGTDVYVAMFSVLDLENFLELGGGDALQASTATDSQELTLQSATDGTIHYTAHFDSNDPGLVTVAFTRGGHDQPGGLARVQVAPPFEIEGAPASIHYGDPIDFSVSPSPTSKFISAYVDGPCAISTGVTGELTVPVFDGGSVALASSNMFLQNGSCDVTVHARVETVGYFDPVFEPTSSISGLQERGFRIALDL